MIEKIKVLTHTGQSRVFLEGFSSTSLVCEGTLNSRYSSVYWLSNESRTSAASAVPFFRAESEAFTLSVHTQAPENNRVNGSLLGPFSRLSSSRFVCLAADDCCWKQTKQWNETNMKRWQNSYTRRQKNNTESSRAMISAWFPQSSSQKSTLRAHVAFI